MSQRNEIYEGSSLGFTSPSSQDISHEKEKKDAEERRETKKQEQDVHTSLLSPPSMDEKCERQTRTLSSSTHNLGNPESEEKKTGIEKIPELESLQHLQSSSSSSSPPHSSFSGASSPSALSGPDQQHCVLSRGSVDCNPHRAIAMYSEKRGQKKDTHDRPGEKEEKDEDREEEEHGEERIPLEKRRNPRCELEGEETQRHGAICPVTLISSLSEAHHLTQSEKREEEEETANGQEEKRDERRGKEDDHLLQTRIQRDKTGGEEEEGTSNRKAQELSIDQDSVREERERVCLPCHLSTSQGQQASRDLKTFAPSHVSDGGHEKQEEGKMKMERDRLNGEKDSQQIARDGDGVVFTGPGDQDREKGLLMDAVLSTRGNRDVKKKREGDGNEKTDGEEAHEGTGKEEDGSKIPGPKEEEKEGREKIKTEILSSHGLEGKAVRVHHTSHPVDGRGVHTPGAERGEKREGDSRDLTHNTNNRNNDNSKKAQNGQRHRPLEREYDESGQLNLLKRHVNYLLQREPNALVRARIQSCFDALDQEKLDLSVLRKICTKGMPDSSPALRALYWKILLGYLPLDRTLWTEELKKKRAAYESYRAEFIKEPELVKRLRQPPPPSSPSSSPENVHPLSSSKCYPTDSLPLRPSSSYCSSSPQGASLRPLPSPSSSSSTVKSSPQFPCGSLLSREGGGRQQTESLSSSSSFLTSRKDSSGPSETSSSPSSISGEGRGSRRSLSRQELVDSLISSSCSTSPSLSLQKKRDLSDFREKLFSEKDDEEKGRIRLFQERSSSSSSCLFHEDDKLHLRRRDTCPSSSSQPTALRSSPLFPPSTSSLLLSRVSPGAKEGLSHSMKRQDEEEKEKDGSPPLQQDACRSIDMKKKKEEERERSKHSSLLLPQGGRDLLRGGGGSSSSSTAAGRLQSVHDHPLSQKSTSEWRSYWTDSEIFDQINKDVFRTRPELAFFNLNPFASVRHQHERLEALLLESEANEEKKRGGHVMMEDGEDNSWRMRSQGRKEQGGNRQLDEKDEECQLQAQKRGGGTAGLAPPSSPSSSASSSPHTTRQPGGLENREVVQEEEEETIPLLVPYEDLVLQQKQRGQQTLARGGGGVGGEKKANQRSATSSSSQKIKSPFSSSSSSSSTSYYQHPSSTSTSSSHRFGIRNAFSRSSLSKKSMLTNQTVCSPSSQVLPSSSSLGMMVSPPDPEKNSSSSSSSSSSRSSSFSSLPSSLFSSTSSSLRFHRGNRAAATGGAGGGGGPASTKNDEEEEEKKKKNSSNNHREKSQDCGVASLSSSSIVSPENVKGSDPGNRSPPISSTASQAIKMLPSLSSFSGGGGGGAVKRASLFFSPRFYRSSSSSSSSSSSRDRNTGEELAKQVDNSPSKSQTGEPSSSSSSSSSSIFSSSSGNARRLSPPHRERDGENSSRSHGRSSSPSVGTHREVTREEEEEAPAAVNITSREEGDGRRCLRVSKEDDTNRMQGSPSSSPSSGCRGGPPKEGDSEEIRAPGLRQLSHNGERRGEEDREGKGASLFSTENTWSSDSLQQLSVYPSENRSHPPSLHSIPESHIEQGVSEEEHEGGGGGTGDMQQVSPLNTRSTLPLSSSSPCLSSSRGDGEGDNSSSSSSCRRVSASLHGAEKSTRREEEEERSIFSASSSSFTASELNHESSHHRKRSSFESLSPFRLSSFLDGGKKKHSLKEGKGARRASFIFSKRKEEDEELPGREGEGGKESKVIPRKSERRRLSLSASSIVPTPRFDAADALEAALAAVELAKKREGEEKDKKEKNKIEGGGRGCIPGDDKGARCFSDEGFVRKKKKERNEEEERGESEEWRRHSRDEGEEEGRRIRSSDVPSSSSRDTANKTVPLASSSSCSLPSLSYGESPSSSSSSQVSPPPHPYLFNTSATHTSPLPCSSTPDSFSSPSCSSSPRDLLFSSSSPPSSSSSSAVVFSTLSSEYSTCSTRPSTANPPISSSSSSSPLILPPFSQALSSSTGGRERSMGSSSAFSSSIDSPADHMERGARKEGGEEEEKKKEKEEEEGDESILSDNEGKMIKNHHNGSTSRDSFQFSPKEHEENDPNTPIVLGTSSLRDDACSSSPYQPTISQAHLSSSSSPSSSTPLSSSASTPLSSSSSSPALPSSSSSSSLSPSLSSLSTSPMRQQHQQQQQPWRAPAGVQDVCDLISPQRHYDLLCRILFIYAKVHPGIRYVQGMNELLAPIYYVVMTDPLCVDPLQAEADIFFCFGELMQEQRDAFCKSLDPTDTGVNGRIAQLSALLKMKDGVLWYHLHRLGVDPQFYSLRWLLLMLTQEFQMPDVLVLWDSFVADSHRPLPLLYYVCVAMLKWLRPALLAGDFTSCMKLLQHLPAFDPQVLLGAASRMRSEDIANGGLPLSIPNDIAAAAPVAEDEEEDPSSFSSSSFSSSSSSSSFRDRTFSPSPSSSSHSSASPKKFLHSLDRLDPLNSTHHNTLKKKKKKTSLNRDTSRDKSILSSSSSSSSSILPVSCMSSDSTSTSSISSSFSPSQRLSLPPPLSSSLPVVPQVQQNPVDRKETPSPLSSSSLKQVFQSHTSSSSSSISPCPLSSSSPVMPRRASKKDNEEEEEVPSLSSR
ncbi:tbc domain-containing protein [Cystoisospora suis]|uniref:Tbc domain-containing protein n=1 Tax=Cystoisospora suis TaxID=483139 RepID=A0A2C6LCS5_9APIC|nr:tbc domain-containing protein [Cystoisospora suis]